jgi:hypothetical protein
MVVAAWPGATKNPQPLPAVGSCESFGSTSTRGVADYNDDQHGSLETDFQHRKKTKMSAAPRQALVFLNFASLPRINGINKIVS